MTSGAFSASGKATWSDPIEKVNIRQVYKIGAKEIWHIRGPCNTLGEARTSAVPKVPLIELDKTLQGPREKKLHCRVCLALIE